MKAHRRVLINGRAGSVSLVSVPSPAAGEGLAALGDRCSVQSESDRRATTMALTSRKSRRIGTVSATVDDGESCLEERFMYDVRIKGEGSNFQK